MSSWKEINERTLKPILHQWIQVLAERAPDAAKTMRAFFEQVMSQSGGLQAFSQKVVESGVLDKAQTWMKDGKDFVMSREQVQKLIGDARIQAIAAQLKTTPEHVQKILAENLPLILAKVEQVKAALPPMSGDSFVGKAVGMARAVLGGILNKANSSSSDTTKKDG